MSDFQQKLIPVEKSFGSKAMASKEQLLRRRGSEQVDASTIRITSMGNIETWKFIKWAGKFEKVDD